jgi:hypothetical protein
LVRVRIKGRNIDDIRGERRGAEFVDDGQWSEVSELIAHPTT